MFYQLRRIQGALKPIGAPIKETLKHYLLCCFGGCDEIAYALDPPGGQVRIPREEVQQSLLLSFFKKANLEVIGPRDLRSLSLSQAELTPFLAIPDGVPGSVWSRHDRVRHPAIVASSQTSTQERRNDKAGTCHRVPALQVLVKLGLLRGSHSGSGACSYTLGPECPFLHRGAGRLPCLWRRQEFEAWRLLTLPCC